MNFEISSKININCSAAELSRYKSLAQEKDSKHIGQALLHLVETIKTQPMDTWIPLYQSYRDLELDDVQFSEYVGGYLRRVLRLAEAMMTYEDENESQPEKMLNRFVRIQSALVIDAISPELFTVHSCDVTQLPATN